MNPAQLLANSIERSLSNFGSMNAWDRFVLKLKFGLRKALLLSGDRPVRHRMGRFVLEMPFSHNLWIDDTASPGRFDNLVRICERVRAARKDFTFIDIGANVGDTVAALRSAADFPVLAIEGDREFYSYLERNMQFIPDVSTFHGLLGEAPASLPVKLVTNYAGSKQVAAQAAGSEELRFYILNEVLEKNPRFWQARMVKIDTDGFDCKIMRGAADWLKGEGPVLFFEYDPHHLAEQGDDGFSIFGQLRDWGYEGMLVYDGKGDYMFSLGLTEERLVKELHIYFLGRGSRTYANLCLFQLNDSRLFEECRAAELDHAFTLRSSPDSDKAHPHFDPS